MTASSIKIPESRIDFNSAECNTLSFLEFEVKATPFLYRATKVKSTKWAWLLLGLTLQNQALHLSEKRNKTIDKNMLLIAELCSLICYLVSLYRIKAFVIISQRKRKKNKSPKLTKYTKIISNNKLKMPKVWKGMTTFNTAKPIDRNVTLWTSLFQQVRKV